MTLLLASFLVAGRAVGRCWSETNLWISNQSTKVALWCAFSSTSIRMFDCTCFENMCSCMYDCGVRCLQYYAVVVLQASTGEFAKLYEEAETKASIEVGRYRGDINSAASKLGRNLMRQSGKFGKRLQRQSSSAEADTGSTTNTLLPKIPTQQPLDRHSSGGGGGSHHSWSRTLSNTPRTGSKGRATTERGRLSQVGTRPHTITLLSKHSAAAAVNYTGVPGWLSLTAHAP